MRGEGWLSYIYKDESEIRLGGSGSKTKKAGIPPSLSLTIVDLRGCLCPAHGVHRVRKPDTGNDRYSPKEGAEKWGIRSFIRMFLLVAIFHLLS